MSDWLRQDIELGYPDGWYQRVQQATFPQPPLYCTHCGSKMVRIERNKGWTKSGIRMVIPAWVCQKGRGWLARLTMAAMLHDAVEADVFGPRGFWSRDTWA